MYTVQIQSKHDEQANLSPVQAFVNKRHCSQINDGDFIEI